MEWLRRIFGGKAAASPAESEGASGERSSPAADTAPQQTRPKRKVQTRGGMARRFARAAPSATIEDYSEVLRDDRLQARVTFVHEGVTSRLSIRSRPDQEDAVWLETRAIGKFGHFEVHHAPEGASFAVDEPRFFLTPTCYLSGERLRNEAARVLTLSAPARERLLALSARVDVASLYEEVMHAYVGDFFDLWNILDDEQRGVPFLLEVCNDLAFLGEHLPAMAEEVATLAEARTCGFCGGSFVFAPSKPTCTGCGAPAEAAVPMPPPTYIEIPDNPLVELDDDDDREIHEEMMSEIRESARLLSELVESPRVREESERGRVFVEYTLDGREFRAKLMDHYAGIRVAAPGAKGDFCLLFSDVHVEGAEREHVWRESERRVFFSRQCSVRSDHTSKEAARVASLPASSRARLIALCERYKGGAQLVNEFLAVKLEFEKPEQGMREVVRCSRELAPIADALPRDFDPSDVRRYRLEFCAHCRWEYFLDQNNPECVHCGAPHAALH